MGANSTMISRLRQISTILLLLFFSLENVLLASSDTDPEKYSTCDQVSSQKEYPPLFSWILEENENEERNDKAHGVPGDVSHFSFTFFNLHSIAKLSIRPLNTSLPAGSQQILKLIGRLRI